MGFVVVLKLVLLVSGGFYAALMLAYALGFQLELWRTHRRSRSEAVELPRVSVIIPARNEEATIESCLESVLANEYPPDRLEVIVIDDGSDDETADRVRRFHDGSKGVHLVSTGQGAGKKHAIETGIRVASGDIILTTDADCLVPHRWIREVVDTFDGDTEMVTGPVVLTPVSGFLPSLVAIESLGLIGVAAGAIGIRFPATCNGANLAYRRQTFEDVGGFSGVDHVPSGDDDMLMHKIAARRPGSIRFCAKPDMAVRTGPPTDLKSFWHQRVRWASKGPRYRNRQMILVLGLVYVFYLSLLVAAPLVPFFSHLFPVIAVVVVAKVVSELALLLPVAIRFGQASLLLTFLPGQLLQIPYVVVVGLAGAIGDYSWKGRASQSF